MSWFERILEFFGLVPKTKYQTACKRILQLEEQRVKLTVQRDQMLERINEVEFQSMEDYKTDNENLRNTNSNMLRLIVDIKEIAEAVQKELSKALHKTEAWGFPNNMAFPGSTSVTSDIIEKDGDAYLTIKGRTICDDAQTTQIQQATSLRSQIDIIISILKKFGIYEKIVDMIISTNAIEYTLAFNPDCTTSEIYYQVVVRKPTDVIMVK